MNDTSILFGLLIGLACGLAIGYCLRFAQDSMGALDTPVAPAIQWSPLDYQIKYDSDGMWNLYYRGEWLCTRNNFDNISTAMNDHMLYNEPRCIDL